jgi:DNA-binding GntR family transcriptional regulator
LVVVIAVATTRRTAKDQRTLSDPIWCSFDLALYTEYGSSAHPHGKETMPHTNAGTPETPSRLDRPDVRSIEEVVTTALRDAILSGELRPGERLLQEQLADQLRVSRIPLRDALRRLEAEGLVRIGPRRGAEVASLNRADVLEIYEIRIALEPDLMRRAVAALGPADSKRLIDMSEQMDARVDNPAEGLRARRAFYSELYAYADRARIHRLIFRLRDDVQRYHVLKNVEAALHDHAELRECIRANDAERASQIHRKHLVRACADLVDVLEREGAL